MFEVSAPICAFYNRTFDRFLRNQQIRKDNEPRLQQQQQPKLQGERTIQTELGCITEISDDIDDDVEDDAAIGEIPQSLAKSLVPNFKVRICDEWGRRINSIQSPNSDLFDDDYYNAAVGLQIDPEAFGSSTVAAAANGVATQVVMKCCSKCTHSCNNNGTGPGLQLQFSSSFDCGDHAN